MCGFFIIACFGTGLHLGFEFREPFACLSFEESTGGFDTAEIIFSTDFIGVVIEFCPGIVIEPPAIVSQADGIGVTEQDAEFAA